MNRLTICFSFLLFLFTSTYSQTQTISRKDFNKDGVIDQVTITEDGGSSMSTKDVQYFDGKTKKKYSFFVDYSFGSFFSVCYIPNGINKPARESLGNVLFGGKDSIDPSLSWLIDVSSSEGSKYNPIWVPGEPQIPGSYYAILESKKYKKFLENVHELPDSGKVRPDYFWIDYNTVAGHRFDEARRIRNGNTPNEVEEGRDSIINGFKIQKIDSSTWVYHTANGVILKKAKKYSWVFISDNKIYDDAREKFRGNPIQGVQVLERYVLIIYNGARALTNSLYVINPETGYVTLINNDEIGINWIENMKVDKAFIELVGRDGEKYSLTLDKINQLFKDVSGN